jgi:hypothetical protein
LLFCDRNNAAGFFQPKTSLLWSKAAGPRTTRDGIALAQARAVQSCELPARSTATFNATL